MLKVFEIKEKTEVSVFSDFILTYCEVKLNTIYKNLWDLVSSHEVPSAEKDCNVIWECVGTGQIYHSIFGKLILVLSRSLGFVTACYIENSIEFTEIFVFGV